jgi:preprotein translocase subunit Sec61beta
LVAIALRDYLFRRKHIRGLAMDHQEKHKLQKEREREQKKKGEKVYEELEEKNRLPIHPAWVVVLGVALIGMVVYVWTFWWR